MDKVTAEIVANELLPYVEFVKTLRAKRQAEEITEPKRRRGRENPACARYWKFVLPGSMMEPYDFHQAMEYIKRVSCYYVYHVLPGFGVLGVFQTMKNWGRKMLMERLGYDIHLKMVPADEMIESIGIVRTKPDMCEYGRFNPDFREQERRMRRVAEREEYKRQRELDEMQYNIRLKRPRQTETENDESDTEIDEPEFKTQEDVPN